MNNNNAVSDAVIVKLEQVAEQTVGGITRISGFVIAKNFLPLIDALDLEANPRSSKIGPVTDAIRESITTSPEEFPFKTKGVLLGASDIERLDRGRVRVRFENTDTEGILDGGHNTLAIGMHVLSLALGADARLRKVKLWTDFRELWDASADAVKQYRLRGEETLAFLIPVELIVPADVDDPVLVEDFRSSLLEICAARNNNVQLRSEAKANQHGYYDDLRELLPESISKKVEWKTNDGGSIKAADILALSWIPLSILDPLPVDEDGRQVEAPVPQNIYRSKGDCVARFERLMSSKDVTSTNTGEYRRELRSPRVHSALKIAAQMPELFDRIYAEFPRLYNEQGGKYGRIVAVKKMNASSRPKLTKFTSVKAEFNSPEGFIVPLVYGLAALLDTDTEGKVVWKTDPAAFLDAYLPAVVKQYTLMMAPLQYDPQKVGKAPESYTQAFNAFETEYLRAEARAS